MVTEPDPEIPLKQIKRLIAPDVSFVFFSVFFHKELVETGVFFFFFKEAKPPSANKAKLFNLHLYR